MDNILGLRKSLELTAILKAHKDEKFKLLLQSNPKAALAQLGVVVPDNIKIELIKEPVDTFIIVYPTPPSDELTDIGLAAVAGGSITFRPHSS